MAWGPGGEKVLEELKVDLAKVRQAAYVLRSTVGKLQHEEKQTELLRRCDQLDEVTMYIERTLNR